MIFLKDLQPCHGNTELLLLIESRSEGPPADAGGIIAVGAQAQTVPIVLDGSSLAENAEGYGVLASRTISHNLPRSHPLSPADVAL